MLLNVDVNVNGQSVTELSCFPISPLESFAPLKALGRSSKLTKMKKGKEKFVGKGSKLAKMKKKNGKK